MGGSTDQLWRQRALELALQFVRDQPQREDSIVGIAQVFYNFIQDIDSEKVN